MNLQPLRLLRKAGIAEGVSFLILLLIAMPLKYFYNYPLAVKYTGWLHGVLFMSYVALAYYAKEVYNWPVIKFIKAFIAAWLPLGTFIFDRTLKKEEVSLQKKTTS